MKLTTVLQKAGYWVTIITIFLLPIFFLPLTSEFYEFNKNILLIVSALVLLLLWAIESVVDRQVRVVRSPLSLPLLLLVTVWLASAVLRSPNRVEAFLEPGQAGTWIALGLFYFSSLSFIRTKKEAEMATYAVVGSLSLLALTALLWSSGAIPSLLPWLPAYIKSESWNPTGSPLTAAISLASGLPFVTWLLVKQKTQTLVSGGLALALLLQLLGLEATTYRLLNPPAGISQPIFLPFSAGWSIALEALKTSPVLGTGPSTFAIDFTRFRPITFNLSPQWATRFSASSNFYLQMLASTGVLGLASYLFLISRTGRLLIKTAKINSSAAPLSAVAMAAGLAALIGFGLQIFVPVGFLPLVLVVIFLIIFTTTLKQLGTSAVYEASVDIVASGSTTSSPLLPWMLLLVCLGLSGSGLYLTGYAYTSEMFYQKALVAASRDDGKTTYDMLVAAIRVNPHLDTYRVAYSRTNLLLANAIAAKADLADTDRALVTQLVQQAIREAKNAVALNPLKVSNVENLAVVYRNLLNFAQGADAWAIASYRQAILLDPVNPNLRIALGGVFYGKQNWDEAIRLFQQAVDLKPDLANAHYNLAVSLREKGSYPQALAAMQTVVQLVDLTSPDSAKAKSELDELQKRVGTTASTSPTSPTQSSTSELIPPEPLPTSKVQPPLELDQSLSPESPATPSSNP